MTAGLSELKAEGVGVLICGHGSRNRLAVEEFARLAEGLRPRMGGLPVEHGYLEFAQPILRDSLDRLRGQGVQRVLKSAASAASGKTQTKDSRGVHECRHGMRVAGGSQAITT